MSVQIPYEIGFGHPRQKTLSRRVTPNGGFRVLHCIGNLGGGGAERQLAYLVSGLPQRNVEVHVAYIRGGHNLPAVDRLGIHLHQLKAASNYDPRLLWRLVRLIRMIQPDIVQTWLPQMDVLGGMAALLTRTPWVMTERSTAPCYAGFYRKYLREWIGSCSDIVIANSNGGREYWSRQRACVIRNGASASETLADSAVSWGDVGLQRCDEWIMFAGRYIAEKNVTVLLDAVCRTIERRPSAGAAFFGEGPLRDVLVDTVERRGLGNRIKILDYTPNVSAYMNHASVFVSVSVFEGCPNTVVEAAIRGCPLVLSNIGPHRELFDDTAAVYADASSAESIANAIGEVLSNPASTQVKKRNAFERSCCWTVDSMIDAYVELYSKLCGRRAESTVEKIV